MACAIQIFVVTRHKGEILVGWKCSNCSAQFWETDLEHPKACRLCGVAFDEWKELA